MLCLWKLCFLLQRGGGDGIQPERLNAEGDSPSALSRGLSVSATPGAVSPLEKRLKDANVAAKEADFRVFQTHHERCYDTEGFASLHPRLRATRSARAFDLSGRAAVIGCGHRGIEGIQPERLNAEGEARVLLAGGKR